MTEAPPTWTLFDGERRMAAGPPPEVAAAAHAVAAGDHDGPLLVFDDASGKVVDLDLRGSAEEVADRYTPKVAPRPRGRPKLGVVAREVTLLPRHWEWLNAQPGGASVALRKLVEQARRTGADDRKVRQEAAYRFMASMAGDLPGYEEALRALFADDRTAFDARMKSWPADVAGHAARLAWGSRA
ncbi:MAG TPA: DUF2239 family protein [Phenylobacterium sp.]|uniref:DUF2239 family protein n=1 Tax=Phenylobacterium sp. TaxID=1871053 RepID=UPI002B487562|nr:DUF2239 family protein [Phenylobacterium sp.]HKR89994.1 DUF2239 family protein [Phenylobacterium sp.]